MKLADAYRMLFGFGGKPSNFDKSKQLYEELLDYHEPAGYLDNYLRCSVGLAILYLDKHTKDGGSSS